MFDNTMPSAGVRITGSLSREMLLCASFAALTGLGAHLRVPLLPVPVTMQVFFVLLSGIALGPRMGAMSQMLYIFAGACGLPVFAAYPHAGPAVLLGATGGYLAGFPLAAGVTGWVSGRLDGWKGGGFPVCVAACMCGLLAVYGAGALWLASWLQLHGGNPTAAYSLGIKPFLLVDSVKALAAAGAGSAIGLRFSRLFN